jgi:TolB protein
MKTKLLIMFLVATLNLVSCSPSTKPAQIESPIPTITSTSTLRAPTSNWKTYTSETFLVTLKYPEYWTADTKGNALYSGQDGFFQLSASGLSGPTAKEDCENAVQVNLSGKTNDYGTNPTLEILQVDHQPACLILPSGDQPQYKRGLPLLVVEYPDLENGHTRLLQLWADRKHIHDFIGTLQFVRQKP